MTWLALVLSLVALAASVAALLKQNDLVRGTDESIRAIRVELQAMHDSLDAQKIIKAEAGLSGEERDETVIK